MSESFEELFEQSQIDVRMKLGSIINGTVIDVNLESVVVNAGLKSEAFIPIDQFYDENGELEVSIGDTVDVALDSIDDGFGETRLSREKAKRLMAWTFLEKAHEAGDTLVGVITERVKGGFTVEIDTVRAFLPGSLVDTRPVRDTSYLEGKPLEFKVIKIDQKRNNVVVSRRAVVEKENSAERDAMLENLKEGAVVKGVVKNLTDYGAFLDLGGIDGLLHITDMAWKRVKDPSEIVNIADEIDVKVLKFDRERNRVSLGLKQMGEDPWSDLTRRFPENARLQGKITNIADYGCFVELEEGVEGLVHVSEMDWTNKNVHPSKLVHIGDEVEVVILDIDQERRRISLGMKQCKANPWEEFAALFNKGDKVVGTIKSITDFGIFIGLEGGIDGLVHLSDVSWSEDNDDAVRKFQKGDELETTVLAVDAERERISLGIKQLEKDPFTNFVAENSKGSIVNSIVATVEQKYVTVTLAEGIEGQLKASELSIDKEVDDARMFVKEGEELEVKITAIDRKKRIIAVSVRAKETDDEIAAVREYSPDPLGGVSSGPKLGDLLKEHLDNN
jgi:small subunit ribosomal protein S1